MARTKNHDRRWEILRMIEEGRPIEELKPAANEEEKRIYGINKYFHEQVLKTLPKGAPKPHFVPADDADIEW